MVCLFCRGLSFIFLLVYRLWSVCLSCFFLFSFCDLSFLFPNVVSKVKVKDFETTRHHRDLPFWQRVARRRRDAKALPPASMQDVPMTPEEAVTSVEKFCWQGKSDKSVQLLVLHPTPFLKTLRASILPWMFDIQWDRNTAIILEFFKQQQNHILVLHEIPRAARLTGRMSLWSWVLQISSWVSDNGCSICVRLLLWLFERPFSFCFVQSMFKGRTRSFARVGRIPNWLDSSERLESHSDPIHLIQDTCMSPYVHLDCHVVQCWISYLHPAVQVQSEIQAKLALHQRKLYHKLLSRWGFNGETLEPNPACPNPLFRNACIVDHHSAVGMSIVPRSSCSCQGAGPSALRPWLRPTNGKTYANLSICWHMPTMLLQTMIANDKETAWFSS